MISDVTRQQRIRGALVLSGLLVVAVALVALSTINVTTAAIAVGAAAMLALMAIVGSERWGFVILTLAFAMVPMYKGLGGGSQVTPPDLLIFIAFCALTPRLLRGRAHVPIDFAVGLALMIIFGAVGSAVSAAPLVSLFSIMLWVAVLGALPLGLATLDLKPSEIKILAWAYVFGHMIDSVYAVGTQHGRLYGLTTHPNFFGEYSVLCIALLTYLQTVTKRQWLVWGCAAVCVLDVFLSGSRAASLALAVLVFLFPIIERSTKAAFGIACLGATGLALFGTLAAQATDNNAIGRILGGGSASGSDVIRQQGLENGWNLFLSHPLTGSGMTFENVFLVHNNPLEVAVATGIFGFFGYVGLVVAFGRTVLLGGPLHRLGYAAVALTVIMGFEPSLYDRASWCAVALAFMVHQRHGRTAVVGSDPVNEPETHAVSRTPEVRGART